MNSEMTQTQMMQMDVAQHVKLRKDTYAQVVVLCHLIHELDAQLGTHRIKNLRIPTMINVYQRQIIIISYLL